MASALHTAVLAGGQQERATVLVRAQNPALAQYEHWGYEQVGRLQPSPDSPQYLALVLPTPVDDSPGPGFDPWGVDGDEWPEDGDDDQSDEAGEQVVRNAPAGPDDVPAHRGDLLNPA